MTDVPARREPPPFRPVTVARVVPRSASMVRVTLTGPALDGFDPGLPAASVRLLLPRPGAPDLVLPAWNGNEFLYGDGTRPAIRTLTPLAFDATSHELDVEVVLHGDAPLSRWAAAAAPGASAAVSGTGRGYDIDPTATSFLLAGDESAVPAIATLLAHLPATAAVRVLIERRVEAEPVSLPDHPNVSVTWCELADGDPSGAALVAAVAAEALDPDVRVWAAGEAAAVQKIRKHLFDEVGLARSQTVVRGYWKHGRAGAGDA